MREHSPSTGAESAEDAALERKVERRRAELKAEITALEETQARARRRATELRDDLRRLDHAVDAAQIDTDAGVRRLRQMIES